MAAATAAAMAAVEEAVVEAVVEAGALPQITGQLLGAVGSLALLQDLVPLRIK